MNQIAEVLFSLQDPVYKEFSSRLMPGVAFDKVIGVRVPALRKLAGELKNDPNKEKFLNALPHKYYEEDNLHAFFIEQIKDFHKCVDETDRFLPFIDNWATCDMLRPKVFKKNRVELLPYIEKWIASPGVYQKRFGIGMLMCHFLDDLYEEKYLKVVGSIISDEYYVNMMIAWYFATALYKQWESAFEFISGKMLPPGVQNKAIQKAMESYRIKPEDKAILKQYKC